MYNIIVYLYAWVRVISNTYHGEELGTCNDNFCTINGITTFYFSKMSKFYYEHGALISEK